MILNVQNLVPVTRQSTIATQQAQYFYAALSVNDDQIILLFVQD